MKIWHFLGWPVLDPPSGLKLKPEAIRKAVGTDVAERFFGERLIEGE